jgi:hypothetical protein
MNRLNRCFNFFSPAICATICRHSKQFGDMARWIAETLPRNPERTVALRKLLEAKDCAVRARLYV